MRTGKSGSRARIKQKSEAPRASGKSKKTNSKAVRPVDLTGAVLISLYFFAFNLLPFAFSLLSSQLNPDTIQK
jgi:hypothetical protein